MSSPVKIYDNKPGFKELRYSVAGETIRRIVKDSEVQKQKDSILVYLKNVQRPLTPQEVEEYHAARLLLGEVSEGLGVLAAVQRYVSEVRGVKPIRWEDAISGFCSTERERGLPESTVRGKRSLLEQFADFADNTVAGVALNDIQLFLRLYKNSKTRNNKRTILVGFFDWACGHGFRVKGDNPVRDVRPSRVPPKDPVPFTPEVLGALLGAAAKTRDIDVLYLLVLGAFAGMRQSEIRQLRMSHIIAVLDGQPQIPLSSEITKTDQRRAVTVSDTLHSWLQWIWDKSPGYRRNFAEKLVTNTNPNRRLRACAKLAGVVWVDNGLRKGFVSSMTQLYDRTTVSKETGHSEEVLESEYKALVTTEQAKAWLDILPGHR